MGLKLPAKVGDALAACRRKLGSLKHIAVLAKLADLFATAKAKVGAFLAAVLSGKTWTILVAVGLTVLGGFLLRAPLTELATGKTMSPLKWILTISWLVTGFSTLATGVGILLKVGAFRVFTKVAFFSSIPLVGILAYKTIDLVRERRGATGSDKAELAPWVTGALEVSAFFVAVSGFLLYIMRSSHFRQLPCSGGLLTTRAGTAIGCSVAGVFGGVAAYVFWILCRLLGVSYGVELFRKAVFAIRVEYFVVIGVIIGAAVGFWRLRRRSRSGGGMAVGRTP